MAAENVPVKMLWQGYRRNGDLVGRVDNFPKDVVDTLLSEPPPGQVYHLSWMPSGNGGPNLAFVDAIEATGRDAGDHKYSIVDAWECSRCKHISIKKHADAHFASPGCIGVERRAALEAAGYTQAGYFKEVQVQVPAWGLDQTTGQWGQSTITQSAWLSDGLQAILIDQFGCEKVHGEPWISKEMREVIVGWLRARENGDKIGSLPKTLEKAGFKRYPKMLKSASRAKCFICGGDAAPGNSLMLADKQYGLCSTDAPKFMVAMDEVLEKMK